jgi:hypothetical protein
VTPYLYYGYGLKNTEQTTPSINDFLKDHLQGDPNYRSCPLTHEYNTINLQYGSIKNFGPYKDIEELRHNKTTNTI